MTLTKSISMCFQKYGDFDDRARRSEFWWFFLFCTVSSFILGIIPLLGQLCMLALLIPYLAVLVRRLHDTGRSAWWLLLLLPTAILGLVVLLIVIFIITFPAAWGADAEIGWGLILIMAFVNFAIFVGSTIPLLIFCALPGTVGPNRYGPDPLNPAPDVGGFCESPHVSTPADHLSEPEPGRWRTLTESIKTCFQKYVDFKGRARRSEFWWFFLFCTVSSLILVSIPLLGQIYVLALLMPSLAVSVRRLHDTGRSAWWILLFSIGMLGLLVAVSIIATGEALGAETEGHFWLIVYICSAIFVGSTILMLIFCALPGTVGPNRYGPDPLNPAPDVGGSCESPHVSTPADPLSEP